MDLQRDLLYVLVSFEVPYVKPFLLRSHTNLLPGNRHPVGFDTCAVNSKVKRQDGELPDLSCDNPSTTTTSEPADPTTTSEPEPEPTTTEATTTEEPPETTQEPESTERPCTLFYGTTSSCIASSDANCPPASSLNCPLLGKRGAHAATATTDSFLTKFVRAMPTVAPVA